MEEALSILSCHVAQCTEQLFEDSEKSKAADTLGNMSKIELPLNWWRVYHFVHLLAYSLTWTPCSLKPGSGSQDQTQRAPEEDLQFCLQEPEGELLTLRESREILLFFLSSLFLFFSLFPHNLAPELLCVCTGGGGDGFVQEYKTLRQETAIPRGWASLIAFFFSLPFW